MKKQVKAATAVFNHAGCHRSESHMLNVLEEKCEYIELLENQKSELGHTLDQTKHKVEEYGHNKKLLKSRIDDLTSKNTKFQSMIDIEKSQNEKLANDLKESQAELGESCAKSEALSALNTENRELQEKLTKQAEEIEDLTYRVSDRKILEGMYHDIKSQNEKLANNLKESQAELGESCAKSEALSALNTDLQNQLECVKNKVSDTCDTCDQVFES